MTSELKYWLEQAYARGISTVPASRIHTIEEAYEAIGTDLKAQLIHILKNMLGVSDNKVNL
jgi:hypothetical protein